jgi:hypothetical protein
MEVNAQRLDRSGPAGLSAVGLTPYIRRVFSFTIQAAAIKLLLWQHLLTRCVPRADRITHTQSTSADHY